MTRIFDGHNDTLLRLEEHSLSFFERSVQGHLDYPRARDGGLVGGFFAIFVRDAERRRPEPVFHAEGYTTPHAEAIDGTYARARTLELIELLRDVERSGEGAFKVVADPSELKRCLEQGVMAAVMHAEGAELLGDDPEALHEFYALGLRSLGLVWSRPNAFGSGVPFNFPAGPDIGDGLSERGRELVKQCNRLRVMIDLSHLNEKGFWDVQKLSTAPLVASHSNAHALCPTPRNLTDAQLEAIGESGGMVGVNFAVPFLRADGLKNPDTLLETVVRHFDYLIDKVGEEHVGFGSDFDGATIPYGIGDAAGLPRLVQAMRAHGFDDALLQKLGTDNWLRVLQKTWAS